MNSTPAGKPPSIRDVARQAQVSYQTVSRVLNDHPNIRAQTRDRVLEAMATLDFHPNRAARMLATNRSRLIGVLATVNGGYYGAGHTIAAIEDAARAAGYAIVFTNTRDITASSLTDAVRHLIRERVEGIIALAPQTRAADVMAKISDPVPAVIMQAGSEHEEIGLAVDNELGGGLAARHLSDLGHVRAALVSGPSHWAEAEARTRGFRSALAAAGGRLVASAEGDWTAESGYAAFRQVLGHGATAVFCANDQMALGLMHAASDHGVRVPAELSVVGFDDLPEAAHFLPPLTTIRQDFEELGRRAVATVLARVEGTTSLFPSPVRPRLIVRASTMPPSTPRRR